MRNVYAPEVQSVIDATIRQRNEVAERLQKEMDKQLAPYNEALHKLYQNNTPVRVELTEMEMMELDEINKEDKDSICGGAMSE